MSTNGTNGGVIVGAGMRLDDLPLEVQSSYRKKRAAAWQTECWDYFQAIGEVNYGTSQLGDAISKIRLFPAIRLSREGEPVDATDPEALAAALKENPTPPRGVSAQRVEGAEEAAAALARLNDGLEDGLAGFQREFVIHDQVTGESCLVGEGSGLGERFDLLSVEEITADRDSDKYIIKTGPDDHGRRIDPGSPDVFIGRMWRKSPRWSNQADSPLRAVRTECDELLILSRGIRGSARSRAHNGVLVFPHGFEVLATTAAEDADPAGLPTTMPAQLTNALVAPIANEADVSSVVPVMIQGPGDQIQYIKHIPLERPIDQVAVDTRNELVRRIGQGLNFPVELVTGMAHINHWTAWQITQSLFDANLEPIVLTMCQALWSAFVRPMMEAAGVEPELARQLMLWYDASALITHPNEGEDVVKAYDRFEASGDALRRVTGLGDDDKPPPEEVAERVARAATIRGGTPTSVDGAIGPPDATGPGSGEAMAAAGFPPARQRGGDVGARLAEIDRRLRMRLQVAANAALRRALERAGNRLRSLARGNDAAVAAAAGVGPAEVASTFGPTMVAALGTSPGDLLTGEFDDLEGDYERLVARAQAQARRLTAAELDLADDEAADLERTQDERRHEGAAVLVLGLLALARERIYNPSPAAPPVGEHDTAMAVDPGLVRSALAMAGGGELGADGPQGGVAAGVDVLGIFAEHGQVVAGWRWVYGDSERSFPPHLALDGAEFDTWSDETLAVQPDDEWLGLPFYRPGDHLGCACDFEPALAQASDQQEAAA